MLKIQLRQFVVYKIIQNYLLKFVYCLSQENQKKKRKKNKRMAFGERKSVLFTTT